jgi:endonuclease YncB( thermonuclease family)
MLFIGLVAAVAGCAAPARPSKMVAEVAAPAPQGWIGPAYVTRVVEGDFIYAMLDRRIEAVRYFGIDVPIVDHPTRGREPYASRAREQNQRLVEGKWIYLLLGTPSRDRSGRLQAYAWVDNVFVNAALVHRGYAEATSSAGPHPYLAYFRELEEGARRDGRGLWHYSDVLTYYRARPSEADLDTSGGHAPDASGGRVFSGSLPYVPALPPGAQSSPAPSPTIAPPGQRRSGPGTSPTYMPAPGRR